MWLTELINNIGNLMEHVIGWIFLLIADWLYPLIARTYNLFEILAKGRLLDNDVIKSVSDRVGLLLGILMFFIVIVNVIQMLVDPDKMTDKEKGAGNIVMKVFVVIVMFGFSSFAFRTLYYVQDLVIDSNVIGRIFIPSNLDTDNFGEYLSYQVFTFFYRINPEVAESDDSDVKTCRDNIEKQMWVDVVEGRGFGIANDCLLKRTGDGIGVRIIEFNGLLMIVAVGFCLYFLVGYCISVGVRMIQLTLLEIISPMAIVGYLTPKKDNLFSRWLNIYIGTYLDVFIRIAIINFAVYLISLILDGMKDGSVFYNTVVDNTRNDSMLYLILIFAIMSFAKKAPDLIKNLFPVTTKAGMDYGAGGAGAFFASLAGVGIAGASRVAALPGALKKGKEDWDGATGFWGKNGKGAVLGKNLLSGLGAGAAVLGGAYVGGKAGMGKKGWEAIKAGQQAQAKANLTRAQRIADGVTPMDLIKGKTKDIFGYTDDYQVVDKELNLASSILDAIKGTSGSKSASARVSEASNKFNEIRNATAVDFELKRNNIISDAGITNEQYEARIKLNETLYQKFGNIYQADGNLTNEVRDWFLNNKDAMEIYGVTGEKDFSKVESKIQIAAEERDTRVELAKKAIDLAIAEEDLMNAASYLYTVGGAGETEYEKAALKALDDLASADNSLEKDSNGKYFISGMMVKKDDAANVKFKRMQEIYKNTESFKEFKDLKEYVDKLKKQKAQVENKKKSS